MMNRFICIPLSLFLLSVCNPKKNERPNGWYYITDRVEDSISLEPIVTINDFEEIKLDSTGSFAISAQDTDIKSIYWQIVRKIHSR